MTKQGIIGSLTPIYQPNDVIYMYLLRSAQAKHDPGPSPSPTSFFLSRSLNLTLTSDFGRATVAITVFRTGSGNVHSPSFPTGSMSNCMMSRATKPNTVAVVNFCFMDEGLSNP